MALGASQIRMIETNIDIINNDLSKIIPDRINTFNYVYNNLSAWADETVVGTTLRNQVNKMNTGIEELADTSRKLVNKLAEYCERQKEINEREEI